MIIAGDAGFGNCENRKASVSRHGAGAITSHVPLIARIVDGLWYLL